MKDLYNIEHKYGFQFPTIYKKLLEDGMFDYDDKRDTLLDYNFYGVDLEVLSLDVAQKYYDDYPDCKDKTKKIFPFAITGAGDWYGFYFGIDQNSNPSIVLMYHDEENAMYYADNLEDFTFYFLLRATCEVDTDFSEEFFINELNRVLKTHEKYIEVARVNLLKEIFSKKIKDHVDTELVRPYKYRGLLSYKEADELFVNITGFKKLNETFFCGIYDVCAKTRQDLERDISSSSLNSSIYHPSLLLNESNLHIDLALKLFFQYDGISFLLNKYNETDLKNITFMKDLYQNILDDKYENTHQQYILPLSKIEKFKLRKNSVDPIFYTDL